LEERRLQLLHLLLHDDTADVPSMALEEALSRQLWKKTPREEHDSSRRSQRVKKPGLPDEGSCGHLVKTPPAVSWGRHLIGEPTEVSDNSRLLVGLSYIEFSPTMRGSVWDPREPSRESPRHHPTPGIFFGPCAPVWGANRISIAEIENEAGGHEFSLEILGPMTPVPAIAHQRRGGLSRRVSGHDFGLPVRGASASRLCSSLGGGLQGRSRYVDQPWVERRPGKVTREMRPATPRPLRYRSRELKRGTAGLAAKLAPTAPRRRILRPCCRPPYCTGSDHLGRLTSRRHTCRRCNPSARR
jgi:hypothetical protein